jgi:hypothetical protein
VFLDEGVVRLGDFILGVEDVIGERVDLRLCGLAETLQGLRILLLARSIAAHDDEDDRDGDDRKDDQEYPQP